MPRITPSNLEELQDPERQPEHLELHMIPDGSGRFELVMVHGGRILSRQLANEHQLPGVVTRMLTATAIQRTLNRAMGNMWSGKKL